jgi:hypothetical protein
VGAVFDSNDIAGDRTKILRNAVKDLAPDTKARIVRIFDSWKGRTSEEELEEILGSQRAREFTRLFKDSTGEITSKEEENLRRLFRESLTFD